MARLFDDALNQYLRVASSPIAGEPFTLACWFYTDDITISQVLVSVGELAATDYHSIDIRGTEVNDPLAAKSYDGTLSSYARSTTSVTANTWHHALAIFTAWNDRTIYLDGGGRGDNAGTRTIGGTGAMAIGVSADSTPFGHTSGRIAEVAVWTAALTGTDALILAANYSPLFVQPHNLVSCYSLIRDEDQDRIGGYDMTAFNAPTIASHPPIIYPAPFSLVPPPIALLAWHRHQSMTGVSTRLA